MTTHRVSLASGRRLVSFEIAEGEDLMARVVVREGDRSWEYLEPKWRGLSFGSDGSRVWWWSARRLSVIPSPDESDVVSVELENDEIVSVFRADGLWLLVCELSLRLRDDVDEVARWDPRDVVLGAQWDGDALVVDVMDSPRERVSVRGGRFTLESR